MAKINAWVRNHNESLGDLGDQVASATDVLLDAIRFIDNLAAPKHFNVQFVGLQEFKQEPTSDEDFHVRVEWPENPAINEICEWEITGTIGGKLVNVVVRHIFHTYKNDRTGSGETFYNGKTDYKPECGGLSLEDCWQKQEAVK